MKKLFTILIIAIVALGANGQNNRSKWGQEMLEAKHQMIIKDVGLTQTQQDQFMPLYQEMEKEIYQTNRDARKLASEIEKKKSPSDSEYMQAAEALSRAKVREGEIEAKYFDKFSKVLSKKQMFLLKQTETKFTRTMLRNRNK